MLHLPVDVNHSTTLTIFSVFLVVSACQPASFCPEMLYGLVLGLR